MRANMSAGDLLGMTTSCGWEVIEKISSKQESGGNHCVRYLVKNIVGDIAFLKAMDLSRAFKFQSRDRLRLINELTGHYLFEREILNKCKEKNMTKVVVPLSAGEISLPNQMPPLDEVYFIVFERAETDLRQAFLNSAPDTWYNFFRAIKHTCLGLEQLHRAEIAHQDIKPSNILNFEHGISKIADLGRVIDAKGDSPFSSLHFAGDPNYAPVEIALNVKITDFNERYLADLNAVGSLMYQTFMGVHITGALMGEALLISPAIKRMSYNHSLPILETAFYTLMDRLYRDCESRFDKEIAEAVVATLVEMCHPDYRKRGAPKMLSTKLRANIRRYTSKVNCILRMLKTKGFV
jgi:serine/threonine protein kinase